MSLIVLSSPNVRAKSLYVVNRIGSFIGPNFVRPTNSVIDVATPTMVRTPLGTSWTYTPGYVGLTGMHRLLYLGSGRMTGRAASPLSHFPQVARAPSHASIAARKPN